MSTFDWTNVLMDEEQGLPVPAAKEDLPDENEKKGEDNGQDSEAAGALSEDDDPKGMKDVPRGEDPNTGDKPEDYDDVMNLFTDEDDSEKKEDEEEESEGEKKEEAAEGEDEDGKKEKKEDEEEEKKEEGAKDIFDTFFNEEGGLPVPSAKEDLPDENEKEGEDNGFDSPASGDLPEDDDPDGMKDVPRGEDPITHMTSKEYDDMIDFYRDEDEEEKEEEKKDDDKEEKEDKKEKKEAGEDKGSDDDGASEDAPVEGEGDKEVKDFADFFFDRVGEETPDADGAGADLEPADPVDGDGKKIDPIGDPDLPSNLTEPVLVPADDPGTKDELLDTFRQDVRFGFGDF